jgi:hypothetical protein
MAYILSGLLLFVAETILSAAILFGLLWFVGYGGFDVESGSSQLQLGLLGIVAFLVGATLAGLAWRGRWHPVADGIVAINVILTVAPLTLIALAAAYNRLTDTSDMPPLFFSLFYLSGYGLVGLVPAHVISVLVLRHTRLLRGIAASQKTKGPAKASPS